jgi:hypothetical protein
MSLELRKKIEELEKQGLGCRAIARSLGHTPGYISKIMKRMRQDSAYGPTYCDLASETAGNSAENTPSGGNDGPESQDAGLPSVMAKAMTGAARSRRREAATLRIPSNAPVFMGDMAEFVNRLRRFSATLLAGLEGSVGAMTVHEAVGALKISSELALAISRALREQAKAEREEREAKTADGWDRLRPSTWTPEQREHYRKTRQLPDGPPAQSLSDLVRVQGAAS